MTPWLLTLPQSSQAPRLLGLALSLVLSGGALAESDAAARYYEDAVQRAKAGDTTGAVLQLKNALLEQPDLLPALLLMGEVYLDGGQGSEAETALIQAKQQGADQALLMPLLGRAWLQQFEHEKLLKELKPDGLPDSVAAEVLVLRGQAYTETHRLKEANQAFLDAQRRNPQSIKPLLGLAKVKLQNNDYPGARIAIEDAKRLDAKQSEVWNIAASLAHAEGNLEQALLDYDQALALSPKHREARVAKVSVLLDLQRHGEAATELAFLQENAKRDPRAAYLRALLAAREGNEKQAREGLAEAVAVLDSIRPELISRNVQLLMLAGLVNHALQQTDKAKSYLERCLEVAPEMVGVRKLLGAMLINEGKADLALGVLMEAERRASQDPQVLSLLATAYMERGLHDRAAGLLKRAMALAPNTGLQTQLGIARIRAGDTTLGQSELAAAYSANQADSRAGLLLALQYIEENRASEALPILKTLLDRDPKNPTLLNVRGTAERLTGDVAAARTSFELAISSDPAFLPAKVNLAKLEELDGKPEAARQQLELLAREHPDDRDLLLARAKLARRMGELGEASRILDRLRALDPDDIDTRILQVDLDIESKDTDRALKAAEDLVARFPEDLSALEAEGRALVAAGRPADARVAFRRMADRAGFDARKQQRIAGLLRSVGADDDARYALSKAVQADARFFPARADQVILELDTRSDRNSELAQALAKDFPDEALAQLLLGDARQQAADYAAAEAAYRAALALEPGLPPVIGLTRALTSLGRAPEAIAILAEWRTSHPEDPVARVAAAELEAQFGEPDKAIAAYRALLELLPENADIRNNLAGLLLERDPPEALRLAREAQGMAPQSAPVLDTLGWILVQQGNVDEGLKFLREAQSRAGLDASIGFHLASALATSGRKDEALQELEKLLLANPIFPERGQALAMQKSLSGRDSSNSDPDSSKAAP